MPQRRFGFVPFLAVATCLWAQHAEMPFFRGPDPQVSGVFVNPIAGTPFTAKFVTEHRRTLSDGSVETNSFSNTMARDAKGRIYCEQRVALSADLIGSLPFAQWWVFDPVTRTQYHWSSRSDVAQRRSVPVQEWVVHNWTGLEDLGSTTILGVQVHGFRTKGTIPAEHQGNDRPTEVTQEYWYSDELRMNLLSRIVQSDGLEQTIAMESLNRGEPPASLFAVPQQLAIKDVPVVRSAEVSRPQLPPLSFDGQPTILPPSKPPTVVQTPVSVRR